MLKKVLIIFTGGTCLSSVTKNGLKPVFQKPLFSKKFPALNKIAHITEISILNIDSTNIEPKHFTLFSEIILKKQKEYDGFVIAHGTYTMAYTSAALSFSLAALNKPVVLTGSVEPLTSPNSDIEQNFTQAITVAASQKIKEVCLVFHGQVIKGACAYKSKNELSKITNENIKVFSSINFPLIAKFQNYKLIVKNNLLSVSPLDYNLALTKFDASKVVLIKLFPGIASNILDFYKNKKAIVLEAFGTGNIPFLYEDWPEKIKNLTDKGVVIVVSTQHKFGESDVEKYEAGQYAMKAGAISSFQITAETALIKLMWIIGNFPDYQASEIKKEFFK